jgi:hypothetical protein
MDEAVEFSWEEIESEGAPEGVTVVLTAGSSGGETAPTVPSLPLEGSVVANLSAMGNGNGSTGDNGLDLSS